MTKALVVGAGLAGAALVRSLCQAGAQVTWLDAAAGPAAAASALPVGMLSPHVTAQPTPLSRLTTLGMAHTRAELQRLLPPGRGWWPTEVDNRGHDAGRHPACLVRPGALVQAWHDEGVACGHLRTLWNTPATALQRKGDDWQVLGPDSHTIAQVQLVFIAAAFGSLPLLANPLGLSDADLPLRPVKGQLSFGPLSGPADAARPQRQDGVYVPCYEEEGALPLWAMGSTYDRGLDNTDVTEAAHARNLTSLAALHPPAAQRMREQAANGELRGWAGVRCASLDRLPLAGTLPDVAAIEALLGRPPFHRRKPRLDELPRVAGLFTLCALGSRGLTLASLCAERLVAQALGRPGDLEADLWATLDPARFLWRRMKRQQNA
ncbi:MAG TPA: FAD-dependent oxidoreductase [Burkholderiaceae bacterium]|nr:FAD-dependent oxidoreductase [Burkholderiaceae bacterium]